jgi:1-acyl-sn-glycerol-3-phosphate acyltransferase
MMDGRMTDCGQPPLNEDDGTDSGSDSDSSTSDWELTPATDLNLPVGERVRSLSRERGLLDTAIGFLWWGVVRTYMKLYHRLAIAGREQLPVKAPFLLIANHASHLDVMVLASALPRRLRHCVYPIAAGDTFFESPVAASVAAFVLNALPMWRRRTGAHALSQLRERLTGEPCGYILFPEGTRSRTGEMASFKSGLGMLVAGTDVPVFPCHIRGAFRALSPSQKLPRPRKLYLRIGAPLVFSQAKNDRDSWQQIARDTEAAVVALERSTGLISET